MLAIVLLVTSSSALADDEARVFFGPTTADNQQGVYAGLLEFINSAQIEISGSIHEIDMITIADALAKKAREGVRVQLVVEAKWYSQPKSEAARQTLESAGVKVIPDTKASGLMHNKFWVVDGKRVWTGSTNLTSTCLFYNPNNAIWIEQPKIAANFTTEFEEQKSGRFGKRESGIPNTPYPIVVLPTITIMTYFSPEDDALTNLISEINSASQRIDIMCFVFSSEDVSKALIKAHQRGIKVRVLLDDTFRSEAATARWRYVPSKELLGAGIQVIWDNARSKLHHKVIIIDTKTVVTGSMNLSANGANNNDENTLIIKSPRIASAFEVQFEKLWIQAGHPAADDDEPETGDLDDSQ